MHGCQVVPGVYRSYTSVSTSRYSDMGGNSGRNGGMAERMAEWSNGGNGYIRTLVACRKTNPSLS